MPIDTPFTSYYILGKILKECRRIDPKAIQDIADFYLAWCKQET